MAIFNLQVSIVSRSKGQSAVSASAYISADKLVSQDIGRTVNYTKKKFVEYSEIQLPENAPKEYQDRGKLWNAVEEVEKAKNSQLARKIVVALPRELNLEQQKRLVHDYVESQFVSEGMCADWSIHNPKPDDKHPERPANPHAHIMLTVRSIKKNGKWAPKQKGTFAKDENGNRIPVIDTKTGKQKVRANGRKVWKRTTTSYNDWNNRRNVEKWRKAWAEECNKYLAPEHQIDHRSYERQGIDKLPTIHEGYYARKIEREHPGKSWKVAYNRRIKKINLNYEFFRKFTQDFQKLFTRLRKIGQQLNNQLELSKEQSNEQPGHQEALNGLSQGSSIQHWTASETGAKGQQRRMGETVSSQTTDNRQEISSSDQTTQSTEPGQTLGVHQQSLSGAESGILGTFGVFADSERKSRQREREANRLAEAYTQRESQVEADKQRLAGGKHRAEEYQQRSRQSQFKTGERYLRFCSLGGFTKALEALTARSRNHRQTREQLAFYEDDLDQSLRKHGRER